MAKAAAGGAEQVSIEDDAKLRANAALVKRLDTMSNWLADLEAKLPALRREMDAVRDELRQR